MEPIKLTKAEKLALLNLCPTRPIEIQLVWYPFFFKYPNWNIRKISSLWVWLAIRYFEIIILYLWTQLVEESEERLSEEEVETVLQIVANVRGDYEYKEEET